MPESNVELFPEAVQIGAGDIVFRFTSDTKII
jgi:hypothetical protein